MKYISMFCNEYMIMSFPVLALMLTSVFEMNYRLWGKLEIYDQQEQNSDLSHYKCEQMSYIANKFTPEISIITVFNIN
jgi:hypothetical protein